MPLAPAGGRVKTWKRRWFILTDNCLYYFEFTTVSKGSLPSPAPSQTPTKQSTNRAWGSFEIIQPLSAPISQRGRLCSREQEGQGQACSLAR